MPCLLPVQRLLAFANPVDSPPWDNCDALTPALVEEALLHGRLMGEPIDFSHDGPLIHAQRIAWLMENGWSEPIEIDVGIPFMNFHIEWPYLDGNHRLYAAALRGDTHILATVAGDISFASEQLHVPEELLTEGYEQ